MTREEWQEAYRLAWRTYYTPEHIKTVIRRAVAGGPRPDTVAYLLTWFWASFHFYNIYPLETGMIRRRYRRDRRPGMLLENPFLFYARHWGGQVVTYGRILAMFAKIHCGRAGSSAIPRPKTIPTRRSGPPTTTTIRRCTSSPGRPASGRESQAHRGAQASGSCRRAGGRGGEVGAGALRPPRSADPEPSRRGALSFLK